MHGGQQQQLSKPRIDKVTRHRDLPKCTIKANNRRPTSEEPKSEVVKVKTKARSRVRNSVETAKMTGQKNETKSKGMKMLWQENLNNPI